MSNRLAAALLAAGYLLAGCSGSSSDGIGPTDPTSGNGDPGSSPGVGEFRASFVPASGVFPYPTDLYFSGSTDGTLESSAAADAAECRDRSTSLDGFSTVASATARFTAPIDATSISGANVIVLEVDVDNATKATIGFRGALAYADRLHGPGGADHRLVRPDARDTAAAAAHASTGATNVGYLVILTTACGT